MTNEQLYLLLQSMLSELDNSIAAAYELMPEDAERETIFGWETKSEYAGSFAAMFDLTGETKQKTQTLGDYIALAPLTRLSDLWQARVNVLIAGDADGD